MTKTVFGWSDGGSACEYYRLRVPLDYLQEQGRVQRQIGGHLMTRPHPLTPNLPAVLPDVVIGQRINRPEPLKMWQMLASGELGKRPRLVYEVDDDLFNVAPHNQAFMHFNQPHIKEVMRLAMSMADAITVSTDALADVVWNEITSAGLKPPPLISVIRNALPDIAYLSPGEWDSEPWDTAPRAVVGWAGSATHADDFEEVARWLGRLADRDSIEFHAIGHMFPSVQRAIPDSLRRHTPWISGMADYYKALDAFHVGIIPLRASTFNRSKSDIKFLEYAARGIPAVVSNFGPYAEHVDAWRAWPGEGHAWVHQVMSALRVGHSTAQLAYEYARSRHVSSVADEWMAVIEGD